ncbi:MAG: hypothetical protein ACLFV3_07510 [Phycisphaeraceae bacterium]
MQSFSVTAALAAAVALAPASLVSAFEPILDHTRPNQPAQEPAFVPLRPGQVTPRGWLRDWAETSRDGLGGRLEQIVPDKWADVALKGWSGEEQYAWSDQRPRLDGGQAWQTEQSAYYLDGTLRLGFVLRDEKLIEKVTDQLDVILDDTSRGNGFLWWLDREGYPQPSHPAFSVWGNAVLGRAMTAYHAGTGKPEVLKAIETGYKDFRFSTSSVNRLGINNETMLEAWELGGADHLRSEALGTFTLDSFRDAADAWADFRIKPDHGVSFNEESKMPAVFFLHTGEPIFRDAALARYEWVETLYMQPHGVLDSDEHMRGTGAFSGAETCNVADYLWSHVWLTRVDGDRLHGDRIERLFFNAAPSMVSRDFGEHVYFQSANRIDGDYLGADHWFDYEQVKSPYCCTTNLTRVLPNYIMHMWMATPEGGLAWTAYGPCEVDALAGPDKVRVNLKSDTEYPFSDTLELTVAPDRPAKFPLLFRIPGWCESPSLAVNGEPVSATANEQGYARIDRTWQPGDVVTLTLPMTLRAETGHERNATPRRDGSEAAEGTDFDIAKNEAARKAIQSLDFKQYGPYASVYYGPLLLALPIPEKTNNESLANRVQWEVAIDPGDLEDATVERSPLPGRWNWPYHAPLRVTLPATATDWGIEHTNKGYKNAQIRLPEQPVTSGRPATIELVPYGCTKFRVSMFPVVEE